MDGFNVAKYTKVLLLSTAIACNTWAVKEETTDERIIRAAGVHVQEVADFEVKKRNDGWWKEFCTFIHIHDAAVSDIKKSLLMSEYFRDHAKASPDKVMWLMAGGNGVMRLISASQEDVKLYNGNVEQAYKNIVSYSVENGVNSIGDFLRAKQIGKSHIDKLTEQIDSLNGEILGLKSDIGTLNLKVDSLEKANLDFFTQLKAANVRISLLEANQKKSDEEITKLKIENEKKAGNVSTLEKLATQKDEYERKAKAEAIEHKRVIDDERAKAKAELDAAKERENAAKERENAAKERENAAKERENAAKEMMRLAEQNSQKEIELTRYRMELDFSKKELGMLKEMSEMCKNENESIKEQLKQKTNSYETLVKKLKDLYPQVYVALEP